MTQQPKPTYRDGAIRLEDLTERVIQNKATDIRHAIREWGYTYAEAVATVQGGSTLGPASWQKVLALVADLAPPFNEGSAI